MQDLERVLSTARTEEKIQEIIRYHLRKDGLNSNWIGGLKFPDRPYDPPAFGLGLQFGNTPIGIILISESFLNTLSKAELEFVILHELAHIIKSHSIANLIILLGKGYVVDLLADLLELSHKRALNVLGLIKLIFPGARVEEKMTGQKELEADRYAVMLQGEKQPAISVLEKLSRGNLKAPSHITATGTFILPAITFEERIKAIRNLIAWTGF